MRCDILFEVTALYCISCFDIFIPSPFFRPIYLSFFHSLRLTFLFLFSIVSVLVSLSFFLSFACLFMFFHSFNSLFTFIFCLFYFPVLFMQFYSCLFFRLLCLFVGLSFLSLFTFFFLFFSSVSLNISLVCSFACCFICFCSFTLVFSLCSFSFLSFFH